MSYQDQRFLQKWEFRTTENDLDSSSDDDHLRPSFASEPKLFDRKLVTGLFHEEIAQQTVHSPTSLLRRGKENHSTLEEPNKKLNQPGKMRKRKARSRTKRTTSNPEPSDTTLIGLRGYMESLVQGIKTAREDLLEWMNEEMQLPYKDDTTPLKPSATSKGQRQNVKSSKTPRNNANNFRRTQTTATQNREGGSSGKRSPQTNKETVVPQKEGERNINEAGKQQKGKQSRVAAKKQKIASSEADQQTEKAGAAPADNSLTLPTLMLQKQVGSGEINHIENENKRDVGNRSEWNAEVNLSCQQLKFDSIGQQEDGVYARNSLRNVSDYEQNTGLSMGNGNVFPFSLTKGSNGGFGMPTYSSQIGLQYLTQGNMISRMYKQGGAMSLPCSEFWRGAFN